LYTNLLLDANYKQQDLLITFRNLLSNHISSTQASIVLNIIQEYNFKHNFNCFVSNNATSNNAKLIASLNQSLILNLGTKHRIRYAGHIINLIVKATLYSDRVS
jgi:hypothetical protein